MEWPPVKRPDQVRHRQTTQGKWEESAAVGRCLQSEHPISPVNRPIDSHEPARANPYHRVTGLSLWRVSRTISSIWNGCRRFGFFAESHTPRHQGLIRSVAITITFVGNRLDRCFPILKTHRLFLPGFCFVHVGCANTDATSELRLAYVDNATGSMASSNPRNPHRTRNGPRSRTAPYPNWD